MSRLTKNVIWAGAIAASVVAGAFGLQFFRDVLTTDALAAFRPSPNTFGGDAIVLKDVRFRRYKGKELVAQAQIGSISVGRDRQSFRFEDVADGQIITDRAKFSFEGKTANYNSISKTLSVDTEARFYNNDFDIAVPALAYNDHTQLLTCTGKVAGRFYGGELEAQDIVYDSAKEAC